MVLLLIWYQRYQSDTRFLIRYSCSRLVPVRFPISYPTIGTCVPNYLYSLMSFGTNHSDRNQQQQSDTCVILAPLALTVLFWYHLHWLYYSITRPYFSSSVVEQTIFYEAWEIVDQRHHLVTTNRDDMLHQSCTACHKDEAKHVKKAICIFLQWFVLIF